MSAGVRDREAQKQIARALRSWGMSRRDAEDTVRWTSFGPGLVRIDSATPELAPGLGIVIEEDGDEELARLFQLRDSSTDEEFLAAWKVSDVRAMRVVLDPTGPQAICRYTVSIERPERVERRFLFCVHKLAALIAGMQQPSTHLWLIPRRVAETPTPAPTSAYDVLSRCLPIGEVTSPTQALARALAHVGFSS